MVITEQMRNELEADRKFHAERKVHAASYTLHGKRIITEDERLAALAKAFTCPNCPHLRHEGRCYRMNEVPYGEDSCRCRGEV